MFLRRLFFSIALTLLGALPQVAAAQASPDWMTLTWNGNGVDSLVQGDCYDLNAGPHAAWMTLDVMWKVTGGQPQYIGGWPTLDGNGQAANICTSMDTPLGQITFLEIRNSAGGPWVPVNYLLTMRPQATGASFNGLQGYAGVDRYIFTVDNLQNREVRVRYNLPPFAYNEEGLLWVDGNSNYDSGIFGHYSYWGEYLITGVQDSASQPDNWMNVNAPYTILPPQPQSLSVAPTTVVAGGASGTNRYRFTAVNGGGMALGLRYGILNQGQWTWDSESSWPWLYPSGPAGWDGISEEISTAKCTRPGSYYFYQVRNSLHGEDGWKSINTWLTVTGSGQPGVSSLSPAGANKGQSVTVTIYGQELCGVSLQTSYPGLSLSNVSNPNWSNGTSFTATFTIAPNAAPGNALVTMVARGGTKTFFFGITQAGALPTITGVTPSSAPPGSALSIKVTGTNLVSPALSTTWSGLTFSNVVPNANGTSLTATFTVSTSAATGNPVVKVTTPAGSATTSLFSIGMSLPLSREYIYLGDRVIAVDSP
jgi:hypothetical protein